MVAIDYDFLQQELIQATRRGPKERELYLRKLSVIRAANMRRKEQARLAEWELARKKNPSKWAPLSEYELKCKPPISSRQKKRSSSGTFKRQSSSRSAASNTEKQTPTWTNDPELVLKALEEHAMDNIRRKMRDDKNKSEKLPLTAEMMHKLALSTMADAIEVDYHPTDGIKKCLEVRRLVLLIETDTDGKVYLSKLNYLKQTVTRRLDYYRQKYLKAIKSALSF